MRHKDVRAGGEYAVVRMRRREAAREAFGEWERTEEKATVLGRDRDSGLYEVEYADGERWRVAVSALLGTWEEHLTEVDGDGAARRVREAMVDAGWLDPDDEHGLHGVALFGPPSARFDGQAGTVVVEVGVEQAHQLADAVRSLSSDMDRPDGDGVGF